MAGLNRLNIRFDVRKDTKKQSMINLFVRTDAENRKLYRQSLQIDTMGLWCDHKKWMRGNDEYSIRINSVLYEMKQKLTLKYLDLKAREGREPLGTEVIAAYLSGLEGPTVSFMKLIDEYLKAKGLASSTEIIYQQRIKRIFAKFLAHSRNGQSDVSLAEVDLSFLYKFEIYLASTYRKPNGALLGLSTRNEYTSKLKALMRHATDLGYVKSYPFEAYRSQTVKVDADKCSALYDRCISPDDLDKIDTIPLRDSILSRVRNLFLFQSWSGMSYADMRQNSRISVRIREDLCGKDVILYNRCKTGELAIVPLFPELKKIISMLDGDVNPNDYNSYLTGIKNMFKSYGVKFRSVDRVGAHTGRHVFGERALAKGFSMEAVSRMMGHTSIRMTEKLYAKIDETKIFADYERILLNSEHELANS